MSAILCRWLNDDVGLSQAVGADGFEAAFSSGYLFGELLSKFNIQSDFRAFNKSSTAEAKLNNFLRLEPTITALSIPFDSNVASDIMNEAPGVANRVAYQLFVALNKRNAGMIGASDPRKAKSTAAQHSHFEANLKQRTMRQSDLHFQQLEEKFKKKQKQQELAALRVQEREDARVEAARKQKHQESLERARAIRQQYNERVAALAKAPVYAQKPDATIGRQSKRTMRRSSSSDLSSTGNLQPLPKTPSGRATIDPLPVAQTTAVVDEMKSKRQVEDAAKVERERRRKRLLVQQFEHHEAAEAEHRDVLLLGKLMRKCQQERRIAVQLMHTRRQKEVIKQNSELRQKQIEERRRRDFQQALEREAELARIAQEENAAAQAAQQARRQELRAQEAQQAASERTSFCRSVAEDIVALACKCAGYREVTNNNLPPALYREWKEVFVAGLDGTAKPTDDEAHKPQIDSLLNDKAFVEYRDGLAEWAAALEQQEGGALAVPKPCRVLGHVIKRLAGIARPEVPPPKHPEHPIYRITAAVVGKSFAGKSQLLRSVQQQFGLEVIEPGTLIQEAIEAHEKGEVEEVNEAFSRLDEWLREFHHPRVEKQASEPARSESVKGAVEESQSSSPGEQGGQDTAESAEQEVATERDEASASEGSHAEAATEADVAVQPAAADPSTESTVDETTAEDTAAAADVATNVAASAAAESVSAASAAAESVHEAGAAETVLRPSRRAVLGEQAKAALARGQPVPDHVVVGLISCKVRTLAGNQGWILDNFPTTIEQSQLLEFALTGYTEPTPPPTRLADGADPNLAPAPEDEIQPPKQVGHSCLGGLIVLDVDDAVVFQRAMGRRTDPDTRAAFHLDTNPPVLPDERNSSNLGLQSRLQLVEDGSFDEQQLQHRLQQFDTDTKAMLQWYNRFQNVKHIDANGSPEQATHAANEFLTFVSLSEERKAEEALAAQLAENLEVEQQTEEAFAEMEAQTAEDERLEQEQRALDQAEREAAEQAAAEEAAQAAQGGKKKGNKSRPASSASKSRPGSTAGRPKSQKGKKKGGDPDVPSHEELETLHKQEETADAEAAMVAAKEASPKPGDLGYRYSDLDIDPALAKALAPIWDFTEQEFVRSTQRVFQEVRGCRERIIEYLHQTAVDFDMFLQRPDHKQEFVTPWQQAYNEIPDDMREDDDTKAELHQRVEDLKDTLWDICDSRKDEAEKEIQSLKEDRWMEDQLSILANLYLTLAQAEVNRFETTQCLLDDYYCALKDEPLQDLGAGKNLVVPLVDLDNSPDAVDIDTSAKPAKGKGKEKEKEKEEVSRDALERKVPLIKRPSGDDANQKIMQHALSAVLDSLPVRITPEEKKAKAAEAGAAEAAAAAKAASPKKKGKGAPAEEAPPELTPEEQAAAAEKAAKQALIDYADEEHYSAISKEDERLRLRLELIRRAALSHLEELQAKGKDMFGEMDQHLGERYDREIKSVDALCKVARTAVEAEQRLPHELQLSGDTFVVENSVFLFDPPQEPPRPAAIEQGSKHAFTVQQLRSLARQFAALAPTGALSTRRFVELMRNLVAVAMDTTTLPECWQGVTTAQLQQVCEELCPRCDYMDWRAFVVAASGIEPASTAQLQDVLSQLAAHGWQPGVPCSAATYGKVSFWFEGDSSAVVDEQAADERAPSAFARGKALKELFFDLFRSPPLSGSQTAASIPLQDLLLFLCADPTPWQGVRKAVLVLSQPQAPGELTLDAVYKLFHHGRFQPPGSDDDLVDEFGRHALREQLFKGSDDNTVRFADAVQGPQAPEQLRAFAAQLFLLPTLPGSSKDKAAAEHTPSA